MTHVILTAIALAAFPLNSRGEEPVVHLTVRPMPAPKPVLRYQLLPELRELNPGNAAQNYLKCFVEQVPFFNAKASVAERARYQAIPLAELPVDKLLHYGGAALEQADWAARLDAVDWQTLERIQHGRMETLPDELGPLQDLAAALHVRFRAEVAGRHFDAALRTAKTMFTLGRHLGDHPTEVADLVGLWVAHLGLSTLEEMVQQPGCPNLYWALTDLPCPLVDLRKGVQGDRTLVAADLRSLHDDTLMTETEIEEFVSRLSGVMGFAREQSGQPPRNLRARLLARVNDPERLRAARERLVEAGYGRDWSRRSHPRRSSWWTRSATTRSSGTSASSSLPCRSGRSTAGSAATSERLTKTGCSANSCPTLSSSASRRDNSSSRSPFYGTWRRYACTQRSTTESCLRGCATSPCHCPSTRSPASRSFTPSMERPPTYAAVHSFAATSTTRDPTSTTR